MWLARVEQAINTMRHQREWEVDRFWPAVRRRCAVAAVLGVLMALAAGVWHAWVARPYETELRSMRTRVEALAFVAQRVLEMTHSERRQFDALMQENGR
jgi:hypothetical protein